ncbi:MAG: hypothetical protein ACKVH5_07710 [Fidelibacterota bacterium]|jgi:hypothetical protein|nr:hypothetical protein [Candidatus Neomarinimicrobiota bacterium]
MKNIFCLTLIGLMLFGCAKDEPYAWNKDIPFATILAQTGEKLVLMDFETEW